MKTIFRSTSASLIQCFFCICFVVILMVCDQRLATFHYWRNQAEIIVSPFRALVDLPLRFTHWVGVSVTSQKALIEENAKLRAQQLLLQAKLHHMLVLERENNQLKELLRSTDTVQGDVKVAQLLSINLDPSLDQVILNQGKALGVSLGQPVLDAYGIMGQVVGVTQDTSKVLLISDKEFAIPVLDQRSGVRAVAQGRGRSNTMQLVHGYGSQDIQVGDLFVSSGFGLRFPAGYPVGRVKAITPVEGSHQSIITLSILAHIDRSEQVLLAWPDHAALKQSVAQLIEKTNDQQ